MKTTREELRKLRERTETMSPRTTFHCGRAQAIRLLDDAQRLSTVEIQLETLREELLEIGRGKNRHDQDGMWVPWSKIAAAMIRAGVGGE